MKSEQIHSAKVGWVLEEYKESSKSILSPELHIPHMIR